MGVARGGDGDNVAMIWKSNNIFAVWLAVSDYECVTAYVGCGMYNYCGHVVVIWKVFGLVVVVWGGIWPGCCHVYIWPYCCHIISDLARIVDLAWCVVICGIYMYMATFSVAVIKEPSIAGHYFGCRFSYLSTSPLDSLSFLSFLAAVIDSFFCLIPLIQSCNVTGVSTQLHCVFPGWNFHCWRVGNTELFLLSNNCFD